MTADSAPNFTGAPVEQLIEYRPVESPPAVRFRGIALHHEVSILARHGDPIVFVVDTAAVLSLQS